MQNTLLVLDRREPPDGRLANLKDYSIVHILNLTSDSTLVKSWRFALNCRGLETQVIEPKGSIDAIAAELREQYTELVFNATDHLSINDIPITNLLTHKRKLNIWWLTEIFGKRSDRYPTYLKIVQTIYIKRIYVEYNITKLIAFSDSACFLKTLENAFGSINSTTFGKNQRSPTKSKYLSVKTTIAKTLVAFSRSILQSLIAKLMLPKRKRGAKPLINVFQTFFPSYWDGSIDEKLQGVPQQLSQIKNGNVSYLISCCEFGMHHHCKTLEYIKRLKRVKNLTKIKNFEHTYIDSYLTVIDLLKSFSNLRHIITLVKLAKCGSFRKYWVIEGINFHFLFLEELLRSIFFIPIHLLHIDRMSNFVHRERPKSIVYPLYEFAIGRATTYAIQSENSTTKTIGIQHGPISKLKTLYSYAKREVTRDSATQKSNAIKYPPLPDIITTEGTHTANILISNNLPLERIAVIGAPRVIHLLKSIKERKLKKKKVKNKKILIAFGQHDAIQLIDFCKDIFSASSNSFVLKFHPRSNSVTKKAMKLIKEYNFDSNVSIANKDSYYYLGKADCIIGTYTSLLMEAACIGLETFCVQIPNAINTSPILFDNEPTIFVVTDPKEILEQLESESIETHVANLKMKYFQLSPMMEKDCALKLHKLTE